MEALSTYIISIVAFIVALTIHEFSHAGVAYILGDSTAKRLGRLTLNPLSHIDPIGLLLLILIKFGWAKPVPFDPRNFSYPRLYSIAVGLAGPLSNFLLAFISLVLFRYTPAYVSTAPFYTQFLAQSVWINVMLGLFNLLPIPPLDGSHFIRATLPAWAIPYYNRFEPISFILLFIIISIPVVRSGLLSAIEGTIKLFEQLF